MTTLGAGDAARFRNFVERSSSLLDSTKFWEGMLPLVGELIPGESLCYAVLDKSDQSMVAHAAAGVSEAPPFLREAFESTAGSHPVFEHWADTGSTSAVHSLGLLSARQLRDRAVQREVYHYLGTLDSLAVGMPAAAGQFACICIERARPFTSRECLLLDMAAPHIVSAHRNAEAFNLLLRATEGADTHVVRLDSQGTVEHASSGTEALLARWFPGEHLSKRVLPEPVASWVTERMHAREKALPTPDRPLEVVLGRRRLVFRVLAGEFSSPSLLLVTEEPHEQLLLPFRHEYRLSQRESEVLRHAALGRSAHEIAERLHISRRTVEKHFESIYNKLGVANRTAAVSKLLLRL